MMFNEELGIELKDCPFCGKDILVVSREDEAYGKAKNKNGYFAVCCNFNKGGCGSTGGYRKTKEEAVEVWNKRHNGIKVEFI